MMRLTVLRPGVKRSDKTGEYELKISDYVSLPYTDLRGSWPAADLMSVENLAALAQWTNALEKKVRDERARRRHAV